MTTIESRHTRRNATPRMPKPNGRNDITTVLLDLDGTLVDTPYDVEAARGASVACVAFRCGGWGDEDLRGAAGIYDGPADLLAKLDASPLKRRF